jgi:hypothetical protein
MDHLCSLRWMPSTRVCASFGEGHGPPLFNDDLLAFQTGWLQAHCPFAL